MMMMMMMMITTIIMIIMRIIEKILKRRDKSEGLGGCDFEKTEGEMNRANEWGHSGMQEESDGTNNVAKSSM